MDEIDIIKTENEELKHKLAETEKQLEKYINNEQREEKIKENDSNYIMNIEPRTIANEIKPDSVFFEKYNTPNILMLSSLFFITNSVTAFVNEYYLYSLLFFNLTTTSLIVHYNDNVYTNIIDKVAVLSVVLYGGYMLYNKINTNKWMTVFAIIISFLLCIYLYIYGFIIKEYCFCDEKCVSQMYHVIMHAISSIGHHFIIYL
jgi:hypothetical protein